VCATQQYPSPVAVRRGSTGPTERLGERDVSGLPGTGTTVLSALLRRVRGCSLDRRGDADTARV